MKIANIFEIAPTEHFKKVNRSSSFGRKTFLPPGVVNKYFNSIDQELFGIDHFFVLRLLAKHPDIGATTEEAKRVGFIARAARTLDWKASDSLKTFTVIRAVLTTGGEGG